MNSSSVANSDYASLRARLLALIEGHSRDVWTDYNTHDPGITLGEHLCFALTEAAHVCGLPIADLLAESDAPTAEFDARFVLPCGPVTAADYRKILVDRPGIRNAWVFETPAARRPQFFVDRTAQAIVLARPPGGNATSHPEIRARGFWDVEIEFEAAVPASLHAPEISKIANELHAMRNLGERFISVKQADIEHIGICTELDIAPDADIEEIAAKVILALEAHISPLPGFKTLAALLAEGTSPEEIFDGPLLRHGFLDDAELARSERRDSLRASDIVQVLLDVPGVRAVRRLCMKSIRGSVQQPEQAWVLPLDRSRAPQLSQEHSCLGFWKRDLPFYAEKAELDQRLVHLRARAAALRAMPDSSFLPVPEFQKRGVPPYQTVLNLLPLNYGVGLDGLPDGSPPERQAQATQLKAFMAIMEQFLAGHREQARLLAEQLGLSRYRSVLHGRWPDGVKELPAAQPGNFTEVIEPAADRRRRRQAIASHLLARFGRDFSPLAVLAAHRSVGTDADAVLAAKTRFLTAQPLLAHDRARAANLRAKHSVENLSGYERFIRTLLGIAPAVGHPVTIVKTNVGWVATIRSADETMVFDTVARPTSAAATADAMAMLREGRIAARYKVEIVPGPAQTEQRRLIIADAAGATIATRRDLIVATTVGTAATSVPAALIATLVKAATDAAVVFFSQMPADAAQTILEDGGWKFSFGKTDGSIRLEATRPQPTHAAALAEAALAATSARSLANYVTSGTTIIVRDHAAEDIAVVKSGSAALSAAFIAGLAEDIPMYLVEHLLLLPGGDAKAVLPVCDRDLATGEVCPCDDPYSFRLTLMLPAERANFTNLDFRRHFEQVLREELPAHLFLKICWLSEPDLKVFGAAHAAWRDALVTGVEAAKHQDALIAAWNSMRSVFPVATLHDFRDGDDANPAVLDQTFLGTFQLPPSP